ncbi:3-deoxy-D-manno-octulosonic acid transferase [Lentibacter algarum]|uniref:3-deoxy-D-manno-octulosonic acid transferase n=1 Tax=Lentibacter algarum TaxID=576131 RepID=UPI001C072CF5|nr:glycosyltransferase N-terminal domain-containing protein [Lentibacter algarum]MBU2980421.1 3-deoxy-D-manno-octulosonic acid transferase [Lentibacter algarum]
MVKPLLTGLLSRGGRSQKSSTSGSADAQVIDLWFHATEPAHLPAFLQLRRALLAERPDLSCLVTTDGSVLQPEGFDPFVAWHVFTSDKPSENARFFEKYNPRLCLWAGGWLRTALISETAKRGTPLLMIDAQSQGLLTGRWRSLSHAEKRAVQAFASYFARDAEASLLLERFGVDAADVTIAGRMQEGIPALPYNATDLEELRGAVKSRPTWLAACARLEELDTVLEAHAKANRAAHRLLLLLVPDDEDEFSGFKQSLIRHNLRFSVWPDLAGIADETAQVLLAEDPFEMGLWLRLAPVAFMGASLVPGFGGHNPYAPANLGSAILYGPNVGRHLESYSRFASVGGARIVRDTETLAAAVTQLSAPDRAAQMAMSAWEIATEGAEVTDKITALVHDILDNLGAP